MADNLAKAEEYRKQGEKKLKGFTLPFGLGGNKYEDAADYFDKAANFYKLAKCWNDAADCYSQLAECHLQCDSKHEAASALVDAAKVAAKTQPQRSTELLHRAVGLYTDMGRLNMAARQLKEIAEVNEKQNLKEEAITFYEQAADLFETDGSTSEATKCRLKIAEFSAELGKYAKAAELFEEAAKRAVENNLLRFSARGYLLQAGICGLCYLPVKDMTAKLERYRDIDLQFSGSREDTLLQGLTESFQALDVSMFATHLAEFDAVIRLDAWKTKILLAAKRRIGDLELMGEDEGAAQNAAEDEDDELM